MKIHQIQCECGKVQGYVHETKQVNEKILHTHAHRLRCTHTHGYKNGRCVFETDGRDGPAGI